MSDPFDFDPDELPTTYSPKKRPYRTKEEIVDALYRHNGLLTNAAKDLGMTLSGLSIRLRRPTNKEYFDEHRELIRHMNLDNTERVFRKKIEVDEDVQCILYHLKTHGRSRGYGNDHNMHVEKNLNWQIEIVHKVDENERAIEAESKLIDYAENSDPPEV